jgi:predicted transcriptional regulator
MQCAGQLPIYQFDLANIGTEMSEDMKVNELLPFVTEVVSAQLSNSKTASSDVAPLIQSVCQVLNELRTKGTPAELPEPAVPVKKSVTSDYIVCLEDGKQLKMLKRYLRTTHGMTPDEYRKRWGLPADYPMVAPNYAKKRSKLAKAIGLGARPRRKRAKA